MKRGARACGQGGVFTLGDGDAQVVLTGHPGRQPRMDSTPKPAGVRLSQGVVMATITKKELIDRISEREGYKRILVKRVVQSFLDSIIQELSGGNRLEFRDFGVFESRMRASRDAAGGRRRDRSDG